MLDTLFFFHDRDVNDGIVNAFKVLRRCGIGHKCVYSGLLRFHWNQMTKRFVRCERSKPLPRFMVIFKDAEILTDHILDFAIEILKFRIAL